VKVRTEAQNVSSTISTGQSHANSTGAVEHFDLGERSVLSDAVREQDG
jgi:hypothetical protein